jgi:hypothetical protein
MPKKGVVAPIPEPAADANEDQDDLPEDLRFDTPQTFAARMLAFDKDEEVIIELTRRSMVVVLKPSMFGGRQELCSFVLEPVLHVEESSKYDRAFEVHTFSNEQGPIYLFCDECVPPPPPPALPSFLCAAPLTRCRCPLLPCRTERRSSWTRTRTAWMH